MGFPMLVLALLLAAVLGGGIQNVIIALAIATLPGYTRLMCGETLSVKENEYIMAQRAMGGEEPAHHGQAHPAQRLPADPRADHHDARERDPGRSRPQLPRHRHHSRRGSRGAAWPPTATGTSRAHPQLSFAPAIAIMLVVFAFNMVGDGLRDALDPKLRGML